MGADFIVKAVGERAEIWRRILGRDWAHVTSPIPSRGHLPGKGLSLIYFMDLEFVDGEQRRLMIEHLAERFGIGRHEVEERIDSDGVPIPADEVDITILNPQRWL